MVSEVESEGLHLFEPMRMWGHRKCIDFSWTRMDRHLLQSNTSCTVAEKGES